MSKDFKHVIQNHGRTDAASLTWPPPKTCQTVDLDDRLIGFLQTLPGKIFGLIFFAATLFLVNQTFWAVARSYWFETTLMLAAITSFPSMRRIFIGLGAFYFIAFANIQWLEKFQSISYIYDGSKLLPSPLLLLFWTISFLFFAMWYQWLVQQSCCPKILKNHPFGFIVLCYVLSAFLLSKATISSYLILSGWWAFTFLFRMIWYLGYDLSCPPEEKKKGILNRLGIYFPFWTAQPFFLHPTPKGESFWNRIEARTPVDFAICQAKGIKLLGWTAALSLLREFGAALVYHENNFFLPYVSYGPRLHLMSEALTRISHGYSYSVLASWLIVLGEFFFSLLNLSIIGHLQVSVVRMAGFNAFRNTRSPFKAKTLLDFFGRYNYYFKEVLLHLFYYPVFFRYFKQYPRLRVLFAVFFSVGFGNFLWHYLKDPQFIVRMGFWGSLTNYGVYGVYCMILSAAIGLSHIFSAQQKTQCRYRQIFTIVFIVFFYAVLRIFDDPYVGNIRNNLALLLNLVGIRRGS